MKILLTIIIIFSFLLIISCGDSSKTESKKDCNPACNTWQTCDSSQKCILLEGRCSDNKDCENNTDDKITCDLENHECIKKTLTCNENKTPSDFKLAKDECGELAKCDDSYDCNANQRCENLFIDGDTNNYTQPCCIEGLRGCKKVGEPCENEFDCESGLCINRGKDEQHYCSKKCDPQNNDCPSPVTECANLWVLDACVIPK